MKIGEKRKKRICLEVLVNSPGCARKKVVVGKLYQIMKLQSSSVAFTKQFLKMIDMIMKKINVNIFSECGKLQFVIMFNSGIMYITNLTAIYYKI